MTVEQVSPALATNETRKVSPRVLLLDYYLPDNGSGVQRAARIAPYLPGFDCSVNVIGSSHSGIAADPQARSVPDAGTESGPAARWSRLLAFIERRLLPYNEKLPWVAHPVAAVGAAIQQDRVDVVISTSPPLACHFSALWLKLRYGLPWVADFRDPLSDNPFRDRGWAKPYDNVLEYLIFSYADAVIGVTDVVVDTWHKRYPRWAGKVHEIRNGYDPAERISAAPLAPRKERILSHVGNLYRGRRVDSVLGSISRLIDQGKLSADEIRIRFIGGVDDATVPRTDEAIRCLVKFGCLEYAGELPRWDAIRMAGESDYLLLVDTNVRNAEYTVPAKLFEYVRLGRPILALTNPGSPVEKILAQSGIPHTCIHPQSEPSATGDLVRRFFASPSDAVRPSAWFEERFNGELLAGLIADVCRALIRRN
jgi:glycosyltransferase involved in cell wall biosynthesis